MMTELLNLLFPEQCHQRLKSQQEINCKLEQIRLQLKQLLYNMPAKWNIQSDAVSQAFMSALPRIYQELLDDIDAALQGDPAAEDEHEIIRAYPGFYATALYRFAHQLKQLKVPVVPRIITEYAHSKTGIDIHPGASIQPRFFIDHGTGVVIGETSVIGSDVKIYQGVTLGALSVSKELSQIKRHPTVEEGVVIYAGSTILGGKTVIGKHSVIGGNTWITKSVPPHSTIYYKDGGV